MFKFLNSLFIPKLYFSFAEGDGEIGEGKGAAGEVQQQLADANAKLAAAEGENKLLKDAKVDLEQRLEEADKELLGEVFLDFKDKRDKRDKGGADAGTGAGAATTIDLDRASNTEIAAHIQKNYKGDIDAAVKDIRKELDLSKQQIGMISAQFDVALTTLRHDGRDGKPNFEENRKSIFEIAKANPGWSAEKCYQQFVLQSKADADKKAEADKKKAEDEDKAVTEKAGVPGSTVQGKQPTAEEAATIAYRKAFGNKE